MNYFIFEDNEKSPVSILLRNSYNGDRIYFSNTSSKLLSKTKYVRKIKGDTDNTFIVFIDVVPNNINSKAMYKRLCEEFENDSNVHIIPIICAEYIILKFLCKENFLVYDYDELTLIDNIVKKQDWRSVKDLLPKSRKHGGTMEKVYKHILNDHSISCLRNHSPENKERFPNDGIFYLKDCNCSDCDLCKLSLSEKTERIYCMLPVFDVPDDKYKNILSNLGIKTKLVSIEEVLTQCKELYKQIDAGSDYGLVVVRFKSELI